MSRSALTTFIIFFGAALAACAPDPGSQPCGTGGICPPGFQCAAADDVCIPVTVACGNAKPDNPEECDDGNVNDGDGCSTNCKFEICGNGIPDVGEKCDDGNTVDGDDCSALCDSLEICGNDIIDRGKSEVCDDGNTMDGDGCSQNCKSTESCGNSIKDVAVGEVCDDGNTMDGDGCNSTCRSGEGCRNGIRDPGEECDDGNDRNDDGCRSNCEIPRCGDGIVTLEETSPRYHEQCDGGVAPAHPHDPPREERPVPVETAECNIDCTVSECGDGKANPTAGEACDLGGDQNSDSGACTSTCQLATCGDGLTHAGVEECDNGDRGDNVDGCDSNCTTTRCGNGIPTGVEACDDGNNLNGDGCAFDCKIETCGNNIVDEGEQCDPGSAGETPACNRDCTFHDCGDGRVNAAAGEQCDDSNGSDADDCRNDCKLNICGDGHRDLQGPDMEACDDGNRDNWDSCTNSCTFPTCGDGVSTDPEQCDLGATTPQHQGNSDAGSCTALCLLARCGDGLHRTIGPGPLEECDDGLNNAFTHRCLPSCVRNVCGDGHRDLQNEACDDHNLVDETACSYGTPTCNTCNATCTQTLVLTGPFCGDSLTTDAEVCDDGNAITETACPYGTPDCTRCDASCGTPLQLTGAFCGDGQISNGEVCDDGDNDTETSCPYGEANCTLCNATCTQQLTLTGAFCGDDVVNGDEVCDDGNTQTELACPYGEPECTRCDAGCATELSLLGGVCGDGALNGDEACDDGNSDTELACPYGEENCTRCNATCSQPLQLTGAFCGDGTVDDGEVCDDGNAAACGLCNATCTAITGAASHGLLVVTIGGQQLIDGQLDGNATFTLADGFGGSATFELTSDGDVQDGNIAIAFTAADSQAALVATLIQAINGVGDELRVTAEATLASAFIRLTNDRLGLAGNQPIIEEVGATGFSVFGLSDGAGGDCGEGVGCNSSDVCQSQSCEESSGVCEGVSDLAESRVNPRRAATSGRLDSTANSSLATSSATWVSLLPGPLLREE